MTVEVIGAPPGRPFFAYQESVHGKALAGGSQKAAACTDCHQSHDVLPPSDPGSTINKSNVPGTCGRCHEKVLQEYRESVHGVSARHGVSRSPVCTDCHGIHSIKSHLDPESSVSARIVSRTTCPQCHESATISADFGIAPGRLSTYLDSYHGLAASRGSKTVANCASCHGVHNIYDSRNPRSTIHPQNLPTTCGKCHPGVSENFTRGKIHDISPNMSGFSTSILYWTEKIYILLIVATIGGMLLHNFLDLRKKADPRYRVIPPEHLAQERLDRNQRIQHAFLASSFIILVLSGFALLYPQSWLSKVFGPDDDLRRWIHRGAALVMMVLGVYHAVYLVAARAGRRALLDLLPGLGDLKEAIGVMAFNLGLRKERPHAGRFGYAEKAEYWALVWGTIVMATTGLALWFKTTVTEGMGLPLWSLDLARLIHHYEAWLAMLAIIVWHFYFVFFDPAVYPMNWTWWTGRVQKYGIPAAEIAAEAPAEASAKGPHAAAAAHKPVVPAAPAAQASPIARVVPKPPALVASLSAVEEKGKTQEMRKSGSK